VLLRAPAKINLSLGILSKRADGYHEISSLMRAIRLFDEAEILFSGQNGADGAGSGRPRVALSVRGDTEGVPDGPGNLAYRAAELALKAWGSGNGDGNGDDDDDGNGKGDGDGNGLCGLPGIDSRRIDIILTKRIPAAAGLAGGSADAAAVLLGLAKGLKPDIGLGEVASLGASLGADVPFCVYSCAAANPFLGYEGAGAALAEGIGEKITPVQPAGSGWVVLVKPPVAINTGEVYALYDARQNDAAHALYDARQNDAAFTGRHGVSAGPGHTGGNDLQAPCAEAHPIVAEVIDGLGKICAEEAAGGARGALCQLSGSGPTVFAYFAAENPADGHRARKAAENPATIVYKRAKEVFPGMFVYLTETLPSCRDMV